MLLITVVFKDRNLRCAGPIPGLKLLNKNDRFLEAFFDDIN